jgi:hypothetical protein
MSIIFSREVGHKAGWLPLCACYVRMSKYSWYFKSPLYSSASFYASHLFSNNFYVRFQVLTAASMKIGALWDIAPCSLVGVDRRFRGAYCLNHQGHHPETTRCYIPEGSHIQHFLHSLISRPSDRGLESRLRLGCLSSYFCIALSCVGRDLWDELITHVKKSYQVSK